MEVYAGAALVGGLYGVTLGGVFFGESMFHTARDASKVALAHLVARLNRGGFQLLDTQFVTDHRRLRAAVEARADWDAWPSDRIVPGGEVVEALAAASTAR